MTTRTTKLYQLTRDVVNPLADRRKKVFGYEEVFLKGTLVEEGTDTQPLSEVLSAQVLERLNAPSRERLQAALQRRRWLRVVSRGGNVGITLYPDTGDEKAVATFRALEAAMAPAPDTYGTVLRGLASFPNATALLLCQWVELVAKMEPSPGAVLEQLKRDVERLNGMNGDEWAALEREYDL